MTGWLADFFRLAGGLLYWNTRKSWFRLRRGRARCPCQSPSDSGRAFETQCEASIHWNSAARFRRLCPLLVHTPQGWRCSVDTPNVRPFWGRAFAYYGGAVGTVYLAGVLAVFIFLRTVGYPVSPFHVAWPPSWHRLGEARGWFFMEKARQAFAANRTSEAILYLSNAYEFDPANYAAGLTLAKTLQTGQPVVSNRLYDRLLHEHAAQHDATAQEWFRALLARGDFQNVAMLARDELVAGGPRTSVWMRALIFAARQQRHDSVLISLRDSPSPAAAVWRPLLETEVHFLAGRRAEARALLDGPGWEGMPPYGLYYQVSLMLELGDAYAALDLLARNPRGLDDETRATLQLDAFARQGARRPLQELVDQLLRPKLNQPVIKMLTAQVIRHPDAGLLDQLYARFRSEKMPYTTETAGAFFSLLCAAGVSADWTKFNELRTDIIDQSAAGQPFLASLEAFFRGRSSASRITSFLPALPLPLEINYALIERYPGPPLATPPPLGLRKPPALSPSKGSNQP